jgi:hypothetical protein
MLKKRNKRVDDALEIIYDCTPIELINDIFETPDFVEVRGNCGGDVLRFRVYNDGKVYEK